jgi:NitT/TauT family transport system permease protein
MTDVQLKPTPPELAIAGGDEVSDASKASILCQALLKSVRLIVYLAAVVALWFASVEIFGVNSLVLPAPQAVAQAAYDNFALLVVHTLITLEEALVGFAVAIVIGIGLAILMIWSETITRLVMPALVAINSTPKVVVAPILIIWLGYGTLSKIGMAFLLCVFPIVINAAQGLVGVEPDLLDLYHLMKADRWTVMRKVRLPSALPSIFSSLKIALPLAIIGAVIGEFVAARAGIGYQIVMAYSGFKTEFVFAAVIGISLTCIALFELLNWLEHRLLSWRPIGEAK